MASFGENLKREREMRQVSLTEIADATRINLQYLKAMENENFEVLPGGVFNRGFIRSYARHLGLDEDKILGEYELTNGTEVNPKWISSSGRGPAQPKVRQKAQLITVIVAVIMLLAGYALFRYSEKPSSSIPPSNPILSDKVTTSGIPKTPLETNQEKITGGMGPVMKGSKTSTGTAKDPAGPSYLNALPTAENMTLQVKVTKECWVAIDADGTNVLSRLIKPNQVFTFRSGESFEVITGNAGGVILTFNGETLGPLGIEGEVKKVRLTRNGKISALP